MRPVLFGLLQLVGALGAAAGVYLLLGLAWSLVIVGTVALVLATVAEHLATRPPPALPAPRRPRSPLED